MIARLVALFGINSVRKAHTASPRAITTMLLAIQALIVRLVIVSISISL